MTKKYSFFNEGNITTVELDDNKTVRKFIEYVFNLFDYYEPFGMDIVTVYSANPHHFILDANQKMIDEIDSNAYCFCLAYHMPGCFYFAEGGCGHHMCELVNHPELSAATSLQLQFDDFDNTVVFSGKLTMNKIIKALVDAEYLEDYPNQIEVKYLDVKRVEPVYLQLSDEKLSWPLDVFANTFWDADKIIFA